MVVTIAKSIPQAKLALQIFAFLGWGTTKISILLLYIRIFSFRKTKTISQLVMAAAAAWTIAFFFGTLFQCFPITALAEPMYKRRCIDTAAFWYAGSITDAVLDFIILVIPIPIVLSLQLPWKQKAAVLFMFLCGGL